MVAVYNKRNISFIFLQNNAVWMILDDPTNNIESIHTEKTMKQQQERINE
jgi:ABC-type enterochelin transport system ATPase subunit